MANNNFTPEKSGMNRQENEVRDLFLQLAKEDEEKRAVLASEAVLALSEQDETDMDTLEQVADLLVQSPAQAEDDSETEPVDAKAVETVEALFIQPTDEPVVQAPDWMIHSSEEDTATMVEDTEFLQQSARMLEKMPLIVGSEQEELPEEEDVAASLHAADYLVQFAAQSADAFVEETDEDDVFSREAAALIMENPVAPEEADTEDTAIEPTDTLIVDEAAVKPAEKPVVRRNPFKAFWQGLCANVPVPGDRFGEVLRKGIFWVSIVLFAGALTYILYNVWWLPSSTKRLYDNLAKDYNPNIIGTVKDTGEYPKKMQLSFQKLYDRNPEIRGWLSFHASGKTDFLDVEYPVMYSGDNAKYLTTDFNGNKNKNGALFFDLRSQLSSPSGNNKSLIIYGHNMASGQMLAGLNKFIGNVNNARVAPTFTMNTLYANNQYKIFAVVLTDESASPEYAYTSLRRMQFADDADFMAYIDEVRAHSLFNYPVDVLPEDELVLLSTCTAPSAAKVENGRLTVVARRVREGESLEVETAQIVKNEDVIMPYRWYEKQEKTVHGYYYGSTTARPSRLTQLPDRTTSSTEETTTTTEESTSTEETTTTTRLTTTRTKTTVGTRTSKETATTTLPSSSASVSSSSEGTTTGSTSSSTDTTTTTTTTASTTSTTSSTTTTTTTTTSTATTTTTTTKAN